MLVSTPGSAQTPNPAGVPAKTTWQPFPQDQLTAPPLVVPSPVAVPVAGLTLPSTAPVAAPPLVLPPLPSSARTLPSAADAPVPPPQPIGTRVVVFQKPAGGDRALTAQDEPKNGDKDKSGDEKKNGDEEPRKPAPKKAATPPIPDPKTTEIRLLDDVQLDVEILRAHNAKQLDMYSRSTNPDKVKPKPMAPDQLPPSEGVRRMLASSEPPGAPRSTLGVAPTAVVLEPGYVVHRRLYFEEQNSERYGWNLGVAQPFISAGYFYKDLLLYPMKLASNRHERYDASAGKAMAGSPVPYLLYPPELTFGGMVIGSTAIIGTVFLLP